MSSAEPRQTTGPRWSALLRALREASGVTQAGWATRLGYGLRTIQRWEHGELAPDRRATEALVAACADRGLFRAYRHGALAGLTVTADWLREVLVDARLSGPVEPRQPCPMDLTSPGLIAAAAGQSLTSFVGRERDQLELSRLLDEARLITLTGPGGVGKTRLALEVARSVVSRFKDGVQLIELAPLADTGLVHQAVCAVFGVREQPGRPLLATLADMLRGRHLLIVLDNCEQVLSGCDELVLALLHGCPDLRFLATSRMVLGIPGEHTWLVPPLSVPDSVVTDDPEVVGRSEAVQLFVQRARAVAPGFTLSSETASPIAEMCIRLDGLPLAIELAAPWTRLLSAQELAHRLVDQTALLVASGRSTPTRQRSLTATLEWSYQLLAEPEQRILARLSVLAGGATVRIAEIIASSAADSALDVVSSLARLVDASLVQAVEAAGGESRVSLLETVREFASERLTASGEVDEVRRRHAIAFRDLAETARPHLTGADQAAWLDRLERDHDNLREALRWAIEHQDAELSGRLAASLSLFWYHRGHIGEGRTMLAAALALPLSPTTGSMRLAMLQGTGLLAIHHGDYSAARTAAEEGVSSARETRDANGLVNMLTVLGFVARVQEDWPAARGALEESLNLAQQIGEFRGHAISLHHLALLALESEQDYASAWSLSEESLQILLQVGDQRLRGNVLVGMARIARARGDLSMASELVRQAWSAHQQVRDPTSFSMLLSTRAAIAADAARFEVAVRLASAANRVNALLGSQEWPVVVRERQSWWLVARRALTTEAFDRAWAAGQANTLESAFAYPSKLVEPFAADLPDFGTRSVGREGVRATIPLQP